MTNVTALHTAAKKFEDAVAQVSEPRRARRAALTLATQYLNHRDRYSIDPACIRPYLDAFTEFLDGPRIR